jgi:glycosyltransferase involved in cell wall biosynthesis
MSQMPRTMFLSRGAGAVPWYRCALPAMVLGQDWYGVAGDPPALRTVSGLDTNRLEWERLAGYDVVVVQYQASRAWMRGIRELQACGVRVVFEIDDYIHAVRRAKDHAMAKRFDRDFLANLDLCMGVCDAVIVSQEYLAQRYRAINPNVFICRNGIDLARYRVSRAPSEQVTIGWAGAIGHARAASPWVEMAADVLERRPEARFVSIGQPLAHQLQRRFGAERALAIPFSDFETYPAAMRAFDIALAPASQTGFYRGKSDLRWLEASALALPLIADPGVYPDIEHGVTGFHAATPEEARDLMLRLVDDDALRIRVGETARAEVERTRSVAVTAQDWASALRQIAARPPAVQRQDAA